MIKRYFADSSLMTGFQTSPVAPKPWSKTSPDIWYTLGLKLYADSYNDEAYNSFSKAADSTFVIRFASLVWMGHLNDLKNNRKEAIALYRKALDAYPGFPVQHDNWKIVIDQKWIEERIKIPFKGVK
jgi:tetratricopeptide (TPR) repeat protein